MIFAAPGAVYISPRSFGFSYWITKKENGFISLSGPLANILVALAFLILAGFGGLLGLIGSTGFKVNLCLCGFQPPALRDVGRQESFLLELGRQ